jgi:uncharacterized protein YegL
MNQLFDAESPKNFEQKCPCVLVIDTSSSMSGEPMKELNKGLTIFKEQILDDHTASNRLEVAIVTFNSQVEVIRPFDLLKDMAVPELDPKGTTKLVDGVRRGISILNERKEYYKSSGQTYYRPYIILMTDGAPDDDQDTAGLKKDVYEGVAGKHFNFWSFGVQNANMDMLKGIAHPEFPPLMLKGVEFGKFFQWLSSSMSVISKSHEGDSISIKPENEAANPFQIKI